MHAPLPSPDEMARWDKASVSLGIKPEILMENASREALRVLAEGLGGLAGRRVLLLAGPGNNGGDVFALARHLLCAGAVVRLAQTKPRAGYKGESAYNLRLAAKLGVNGELVTERNLSRLELEWTTWRPDAVVDGLLGTGFSGSLSSFFLRLVQVVNALRASSFIFAVDVPSGLDARTGRPAPEAVRAHATATFEAAKFGLALPWAAAFTGRLYVRAIGIPPQVKDEHPASAALLGPETLGLLPGPGGEGHKGTYGHLLVLGGSYNLTGAPVLASLGGLRSGCGLSTIGCPSGLSYHLKSGMPELMTLPLGKGNEWNGHFMAELGPHLGRFQALVVGPGLGRTDGARDFLRRLLAEEMLPPLVLDADALYWLAQDTELPRLPEGTVLTPHPLEAGRILGTGAGEVQDDRRSAVHALIERTGAVVILKGAGTLVAAPGSPVHLCSVDAPALSVGGSGDVLAGCVGALLARGLPPLDAARLGAYLHAQAGLLLSNEFPARGCTATEIAAALPRAMQGASPCARP
ncbi:NAD(P)H-hydrate epimerase [Desulfovibrio sp. X2]|uniref:NAD(P)H-hydrate dehydratase n=1 Tax=Desulfovibrio sp. X2 TaxID=941449 RepID=UPI0003589FF5|nr:NAD(P)H-hydrate dehydratase [Desulfovibrio sp. X2]EPR42336.1 NAD(P)H-hydrate epimerase [Desulfovibrio sp. X2]